MEKIEFVKTKILLDSKNKTGLCYKKVSANNIVCIVLETKTSYCKIAGFGGGETPNITLIHEYEEISGCTIIEFPEYKGWDIFSAYAGKSSIKITLVKEE